jgi:hypothetical protein
MSTMGDPGRGAFAVTTHNTNTVTGVKSLYVGGAGDVAIIPIGGTDPVVFKNVPAGGYVLVQPSVIRTTGTTATDIVAIT